MLTIHGRRNSHNVKKVLWLAGELGLAFDRRDVGLEYGMDEAYLAKNPNALIPTIEDGDLIMWESNAILRYLAARYGREAWWPADAGTRAIADKWMDWQLGYAEVQRAMFMNMVRRPAAERDMAVVERGARRCGEMMLILDRYLARSPWLSGEAIGIGDLPIGTYAHTWFTLAIERPETPHVAAWYARLRERAAYVEHVMIPLT